MRTLIKTFAAVLILVTFTFANERTLNTEDVIRNYEVGLIHDNPGVVESTIRAVILMKIAYPDADYVNVIDELEDLIMEGANKNIRLKALIASDYLNNFEQYSWLKDGNYEEGDQVFDAYLKEMRLNGVAKTN